jgi:hypothetical protein
MSRTAPSTRLTMVEPMMTRSARRGENGASAGEPCGGVASAGEGGDAGGRGGAPAERGAGGGSGVEPGWGVGEGFPGGMPASERSTISVQPKSSG